MAALQSSRSQDLQSPPACEPVAPAALDPSAALAAYQTSGQPSAQSSAALQATLGNQALCGMLDPGHAAPPQEHDPPPWETSPWDEPLEPPAAASVEALSRRAPAASAGTAAGEAPASAADQDARYAEHLDEVQAGYRRMVALSRALGCEVAADNLEHFLDGSGSDRMLDSDWLRSFLAVNLAEQVNERRFEQGFSDLLEAGALESSKGRVFTNSYWDRTFTAWPGTELYYASGTSTLNSVGCFTLERVGSLITVQGDVSHNWWDPYDWHWGMQALIPFFGAVRDDDALALESAGRGRSFLMWSEWSKDVTGTLMVLGNTISHVGLTWSDR